MEEEADKMIKCLSKTIKRRGKLFSSKLLQDVYEGITPVNRIHKYVKNE